MAEPPQDIRFVPAERIDGVDDDLRQNGWTIMRVEGRLVEDKVSFIRRFAEVVELDPPLIRHNNWDGFADSLSGGLFSHCSDRVALIWRDANVMRKAAPAEFNVALSVLRQVIHELADADVTVGRAKQVRVVLSDSDGP